MVKSLIAIICILAFIEYYSLGVMFVAKKACEKDYKLAFIPFYSFFLVGKITGIFTVLTIPVKKYHSFMLTIVTVGLLAFVYALWGDLRLPKVSAMALWEIMSIIFVICILLWYVSLLIASKKVYRRFNIEKENLAILFSMFIITIPIMYYIASKNTPKTPSEMY